MIDSPGLSCCAGRAPVVDCTAHATCKSPWQPVRGHVTMRSLRAINFCFENLRAGQRNTIGQTRSVSATRGDKKRILLLSLASPRPRHRQVAGRKLVRLCQTRTRESIRFHCRGDRFKIGVVNDHVTPYDWKVVRSKIRVD